MTLFKNIISSIIFLGIFALHPSLNKGNSPITSLQHFVYGNSLKVSTNDLIDKNLLEIKWIGETSNNDQKNLIIFKDGKQVNKIPSEKGHQLLLVFYNGKVTGVLSQNKRAAKQAHQYNIELLSNDNSLFFKGEILGPSPFNGTPITMASL